MTLTQITEKGIKDGEIINADINASAAIAGTKISPDFGSQDPITTGKLITNSSSSGDYIRLYAASGTGKWDIYGNGANLRISDNDSAGSVVIDTNLDVGAQLDVAGNIKLSGSGAAFTNNSQPLIYRSGSDSGSYPFDAYGHLIFQTRGDSSNRDIIFATGTSGANMTVIDSSGSLLIGHTSSIASSQKLQVFDDTDVRMILANTTAASSQDSTLYFAPANNIVGASITSTSEEDFSTSANRTARLTFGTRKDGTLAEAMRIDSNGRVQIGSTNNSSTGTKFVVGTGNNLPATALINTQDTDVNALTLSNWDGSVTTNKVMMHFDNSGVGGFDIGMPAATDNFVIQDTDSSIRLRINADGHVDITGPLDCEDGLDVTGGGLTVNSGPANTCATFTSSDSGAVVNITDNSARSSIEQNGTDLKIIADTDAGDDNSTIKFLVDNSTKMILDSSGRLRIGTGDIGTAAADNLTITDSGHCGITIRSGDNDSGAIYFGDDDTSDSAHDYRSIILYDHINEGLKFYVNGNTVAHQLEIKSNKDLSIPDGNLVVANGHGIDFSATANASQGSAANHNELLDDYEEGTWSPGVDKSSSSMSGVSYSDTSGTYTKVGRLVTVWFDITVTGGGTSGSGAPYITELPFASLYGSGSGQQNGGYGAPQFRDATLANSNLRIYGNSSYVANSQIYIQQYNSSGNTENSTFNTTGRITGQATYFTT